MRIENFKFNSARETKKFAETLGANAKKGSIFALIGDLGTGKTCFTKGIARGLSVHEKIVSPTFTILEIYEGRLPLYHFDLYRLNDETELDMLGFDEYWDGDGVSVIEWADRAKNSIPSNTTWIYLDYIDENRRGIRIEYPVD